MPFVSVSGTQQKDENTRKVIRRHVMLGKNRGRTPQKPKQSTLTGTTVFSVHQAVSDEQQFTRPQPPISSDVFHMNFADVFSDTLQNETVRFCTTMTENMFVLSSCIAFDSQDDWALCLQPLCRDSLYANVMVFGSQLYIDKSFHQTTSCSRNTKQTTKYYDKSLRLLRERLPDINGQESVVLDAVVLAIYTLAMHALLIGNLTTARTHVCGLSSLMSKRSSGFPLLSQRTKQLIELSRCDLSISLATGLSPLLSSGSFQKQLGSPPRLLLRPTPELCEIYIDNEDLVVLWQALVLFCADVNAAIMNHSQLSQDLLLETMSSTMYRAVDLSLLPGSIEEAVRLTILTFCKMIFLDWPLLRLPLPWLENQLEAAIDHLMRQSQQDIDDKLLLWIVVIYILAHKSVPLSQNCRAWSWLQEVSNRCGLHNLADTKKVLSRFLWVGVVCDRKAQSLLNDVLAEER